MKKGWKKFLQIRVNIVTTIIVSISSACRVHNISSGEITYTKNLREHPLTQLITELGK